MASNAMNDIYQAVCASLSTLTGSTIKWFEVDMNQAKKEGVELPMDYPAVIFKHTEVLWETGSTQIGLVSMEAVVIYPVLDNEQLIAPQPSGRADVIRRNVDLATIHSRIDGLSGPNFNAMKRLNSKEEFDNELMAWKHTFNYYCNITNDGSAPPASFTINFNYITNMNQLLNRNKCCK